MIMAHFPKLYIRHLMRPNSLRMHIRPPLRCLSASASFEFETSCELKQLKENLFTIDLKNDWSVGDALNGGYLMALAVKAGQTVSGSDPISITGYYMNKGLENITATVDVEVLSTSKSASTVRISITQLGLVRTRYIGIFGKTKEENTGLNHSKLSPPILPPIADCVDGAVLLRKLVGSTMTISHRMDYRMSAESPYVKGFLSQKQVDRAELDCWVALADGFEPDIRSLSLFSDSFPPCVLNLANFAWVPTLEYAVQFWAHPPRLGKDNEGYYDGKQYLRARYRTTHVVNGMLYTDGELWSADGQTLLATSRQMARLMIPRSK